MSPTTPCSETGLTFRSLDLPVTEGPSERNNSGSGDPNEKVLSPPSFRRVTFGSRHLDLEPEFSSFL